MNTSNQNLYFVGLMGSGKTTVGRLLARRMGREFLDSDHVLEERTGVRVPVIFDLEGEQGFRRREENVIAELATTHSGIILATGGGAILSAKTRQMLSQTGWVVYLDVPTRVLFERTRQDPNRPLLKVEDPMTRLNVLREQRDPLYREVANMVLEGTHMNPQSAASKILREWEKQCIP